jgi:antitoxin component of MazEF toxin-antitoxin module
MLATMLLTTLCGHPHYSGGNNGMTIKNLQRIGNSSGVILPTTMLEQLGVEKDGAVVLRVEGNQIIITSAPNGLRHGSKPQRFRDAMDSTLSQYDDALHQLAGSDE